MERNFKILKKLDKFGLNQRKFGEKYGINESIVSDVVLGKRNLTDTQQRKWAKALKCEPVDIFGSLDEDNKSTLYNI